MSEVECAVSRFRMVVADLDGTLLDPMGRVTPRTKAVAAQLRERGIPLVLATSRRLTGAAPVASALGIDGPLVLYDGALVRHYPSGRQLYANALPANTAQAAAEVMAAHGLRPIAQHADSVSESLLLGPPGAEQYDAGYLTLYGSHAEEVPVSDLCLGRPDPMRLVAFGPLERLAAAAQAIAALDCGWQLLPSGNYGTSELSVFAATASKATAVAELARRQRIPMDRVFAIGDGINDVSLLAAVGCGVAMGNGGVEARSVARALAPPNDADGAAWAIEVYVLGIRDSDAAATTSSQPSTESHP